MNSYTIHLLRSRWLSTALAALTLSSPLSAEWNPRKEMYPIQVDRTTTVIAASPAPKLTPEADYLQHIKDFSDLAIQDLGTHDAATQSVHRHALVRQYAMLARINGDQADADKAFQFIEDDLTCFSANGNCANFDRDFSSLEFASATRALWHLVQGGHLNISSPPSDRLQKCIHWLELILDHYTKKERGAMNRALGLGMGLDALVFLEPNDPNTADRKRWASDIWNDWHKHGDLAENADSYLSIDYQHLIWWIQFKELASPGLLAQDEKLRRLAYRVLDYATPFGAQPLYGDSLGFNTSQGNYLFAYEAWGAAYRDGAFRHEASQLFHYINNQIDRMHFWGNTRAAFVYNVMEAYLAADTALQPYASEVKSTQTKRKEVIWKTLNEYEANDRTLQSEIGPKDTPDKVVFRNDRSADSEYALISASPRIGHDHTDAGAINAYISKGSYLLSSPTYLLKDHEYHNTFRVEAARPQSERKNPRDTGALSPVIRVSNTQTNLIVTFDAKSISGSRYLAMNRVWGGSSNPCVEITDEWQSYVVGVMLGSTNLMSTDLLIFPSFGRTMAKKPEISPADGVFLIDNLRVSDVDSGSVLISLDFENGAQGFSALVDGRTTRGIVSHELGDAAKNSVGSLRVSMDVGRYPVELTDTVEVSDFAEDGDFGFTKIHMPRYLNKPLTVDRRILFLGDAGIWVRDDVTALNKFSGRVGPTWQLGDTDGQQGETWINSAQPALPVPQVADIAYLMHWKNKPRDLLIQFPETTASTLVDDVSQFTLPDTPDVLRANNHRKRVWRYSDITWNKGDQQRFNSLLRPHAPKKNAEPLAATAKWLIDTEALSVIEIRNDVSMTRVIAGINPLGSKISIPTCDASTDAIAFRISMDIDGIAAYDLVSCTQLNVGGEEIFKFKDRRDEHSDHRVNWFINGDFEREPVEVHGIYESKGDASVFSRIPDPTEPSNHVAQISIKESNVTGQNLSHNNGAVAHTRAHNENHPMTIAFEARDVSGSGILNAQRIWGGSNHASIPLASEWKSYVLNIDQYSAGMAPVFSAVSEITPGLSKVANGVFMLDQLSVSPSPNRVHNGGFNDNADNAQGFRQGAVDPTMSQWNANEDSLGLSGSLQVNQTHVAGMNAAFTGVKLSTSLSIPNELVRISFSAKSLSGARTLRIGMPWSEDSFESVQIQPRWLRHELYLEVTNPASTLFITAVDPTTPEIAADASYLIDSIIMTPVSNLAVNPDLDDHAAGYKAYVDGVHDNSLIQWHPNGQLIATIPSSQPAMTTGITPTVLHPKTVRVGNRIRISFDAHSLSGSSNLAVADANQGIIKTVKLSTKETRRITVETDANRSLPTITLLNSPNATTTGSGRMLINNLSINQLQL